MSGISQLECVNESREHLAVIDEVGTLAEYGYREAALDSLVGRLGDAMMRDKVSMIDAFFDELLARDGRITDEPVDEGALLDLTLAALAVTIPMRGRLAKRSLFFARFNETLVAMQGEDAAGHLLRGL